MSDLRSILLTLSNEFQEQIRLINEFGFVLNTTSRTIDGQPVDLSVPKQLHECIRESESKIEKFSTRPTFSSSSYSSTFSSSSSTATSSTAVEKSALIEALPVETSPDSLPYDEYDSRKLVGRSFDDDNDDRKRAGWPIGANTHYCSRCKRNYVKNCVENHRWAIVRRHYKTAPCRYCGKYFSQMFMVKHKCRQKNNGNGNYHRKVKPSSNPNTNPVLPVAAVNAVYCQNRNTEQNKVSATFNRPATLTTNPKIPNLNIKLPVNPNVKIETVDVMNPTVAKRSVPRQRKVDANEAFRSACNKIFRLPLYKDAKYSHGRTNCPECRKSVTFSYVLEHILMKHERLTSAKFNHLTRTCPICNQDFRSFHSLSYHVTSTHVETYVVE